MTTSDTPTLATSTPLENANRSADDEIIKKIIEEKVEAFGRFRRERRLSIRANIAYLTGNQNIMIQGGTLVPIPEASAYRTKVVANLIEPAVRNDIALSIKAFPEFQVSPASTDETDKATALAGQNMLAYIQRVNGPHLGREATVLWYDIDGVGWRKVWWKARHKVVDHAPAVNPETEGPLVGPDGRPQMEPVFRGEVVVENVPNIELIFDHRVKNPTKLPWIIQHKHITIAKARELAGTDFVDGVLGGEEGIKPTNLTSPGGDTFDFELMGDFSRLSDDLAPKQPKMDDAKLSRNDKMVDYYEFWHLPDANLSFGAFAVMIGGKILVNNPYPLDFYTHGELPYIPSAPLSLDGIAFGAISRISQGRPLQREYNWIRTLIMDGSDAHSNAVYFASSAAELDIKKISNSNLNYVEYSGGLRPHREPGLSLPGSLFSHLQVVKQDLNEVFSFHEPSKGQMPKGGPRSGVGLQVLKEGDQTQHSPLLAGFNESDRRVAYQALVLGLQGYRDGRFIEVCGADNAWTAYQIKPEELQGKVNVQILAGSGRITSQALEQEKTMMAWQSGLLGNPQDPEVRMKVLKTLDIGSFQMVFNESNKQINFAQREFQSAEQLVQSMPPIDPAMSEEEIKAQLSQYVFIPPTNPFDDDYVHIREHRNFTLDRYHQYISSGQQELLILIQAMLQHSAMHEKRLFDQQVLLMQLQNPQNQEK